MGVKGLTSFVKQIQHAVSEEVTIPANSDGSTVAPASAGPFIIDGWAWIYRAYLDHFADAIRGGEYIGYTLHVRHFVDALRSAAIEPIFVFDGPYLPLKIPTVLSRLGETAPNHSAFMRSSSRSKPGFQVSMGAFPPLLYDCTLNALRQVGVQIVVEEIEADSAVAELADRMSGWAVSNDSDFFVLCSRGTQCKGYVPIDSLQYITKPASKGNSDATDAGPAADFDEDGFAQVGKSGRAKGRKGGTRSADTKKEEAQLAGRPPSTAEEGVLTGIRFTSYSSTKLAAALGITPPMLPLLAALVGNDYTASIQRRILDPALPNGPLRITFIANAIKTETLRMASSGNKTPGLRSGTATPSATRQGLGRTGSGWGALAARGGGSALNSATATPVGDALHPKLDEALAALALNDPVRFMVQSVVDRILSGVAQRTRDGYVTTGEQEDLVDAVIDSVATYSLLSDASAVHRSTPSNEFFVDAKTEAARQPHRQNLRQYRDAYVKGHFDRVLVESVTQRICTNRMAPEDPDQKSIQSTHARDVRDWTFSTLFSTWGMSWARETLEEPLPPALEDEDDLDASHSKAIPILAGPGPNKVNWAEEGDPDEMIPVQTPPSSFGSSMYQDDEDDDADADEEDEVRSRPGSAVGLLEEDIEVGGIKPPPAVSDYSRKGDRYAAELRPILTFDSLATRQREQFGIEPPEALRKYLRA